MPKMIHRKSNNRSHRDIAVPFDCKALDDNGTFEGYGSVFGVEDSYGEVVAKGAFSDNLNVHRAKSTMPAMLWQHDPARPIGVYEAMKEDAKGLYVKGRLALETAQGREAHA